MDYVLGGVAALITGNVTPNRPKSVRKALTPTKHQSSPNVTPKSMLVDDRSIFLSPTVQKKKAIVKKSPKRIFQNSDMDTTENDGSQIISPKADKAKKHLKDELESSNVNIPLKLVTNDDSSRLKITKTDNVTEYQQQSNENTPKKQKKNKDSSMTNTGNVKDLKNDCNNLIVSDILQDNANSPNKLSKKKKQRRKSIMQDVEKEIGIADTIESDNREKLSHLNNNVGNANQQVTQDDSTTDLDRNPNKGKSKKRKSISNAKSIDTNSTKIADNQSHTVLQDEKENESTTHDVNKKVKNKKKRNKTNNIDIKPEANDETELDYSTQVLDIKPVLQADSVSSIKETFEHSVSKDKKPKKKLKKHNKVNPNAVTDKDSESEHGSDDEIESENEQINRKLLEKDPADSSSEDDDEDDNKEIKQPVKKGIKKSENVVSDPSEVKRTLFVGNVPFSKKCKKDIKRIFNKYGQIETVRIRTIPVKDARDTPKLAVIKNELHPDRSTVNVYVKFVDEASIEEALNENNTVLNGHHLRVSRSSSTGAEHDYRCSVFIGNMPFAMEDEALRAKFENCGEIDSVRIIRDKKTNVGKGFGYVNFKSKDGVELALLLSEEDLTIKNRILRVKRCTQGSQKQGNKFNQTANRSYGNNNRSYGNNNRSYGNNNRSYGNNNGSYGNNHGNNRHMGNFQRQDNNESVGAHRRVMNKRKYQEGGGDGPANKRQNTSQPRKEKKPRKEFVGMTAEKKKKHKFDKSQKKKKILSEILTK